MQLRNRKILRPQPKRAVQPNDDTDIESTASESSSEADDSKTATYGAKNKIFDRRSIYAEKVNDIWCIDLVDLSKQEAGYILNCIDIFSRKAEAKALNEKSSSNLKIGLEYMFEKFGAKPNMIWSDKESGIDGLNTWLQSLNIKLYHTNNSYLGPNTHAVSIVERFNRSMKSHMLLVEKTKNPKQNFIQLRNNTIKNFIPLYNSRVHRTLKRTPNDIYEGDAPIMRVKQETLARVNKPKVSMVKIPVGTMVYLQKPSKKNINAKFDITYYPKPFKIIQVLNTNPITYQLQGIEGSFYRNQFKKKV